MLEIFRLRSRNSLDLGGWDGDGRVFLADRSLVDLPSIGVRLLLGLFGRGRSGLDIRLGKSHGSSRRIGGIVGDHFHQDLGGFNGVILRRRMIGHALLVADRRQSDGPEHWRPFGFRGDGSEVLKADLASVGILILLRLATLMSFEAKAKTISGISIGDKHMGVPLTLSP